jgi:subtilisin
LGKISRTLITGSTRNGDITLVEVPVEHAKDERGHGSAAAGLITGIAPAARIVSIQVLDGRLTCSRQALSAALHWAVRNGIRLIYTSTSTRSEAIAAGIKTICELAYRQNSIVVAPLENSGHTSYPAAFPSVIGVDWGTFDSVYDVRYREGADVEYIAHGMRIPAPSAAGDYVNVSGTSFASANVTGLIALLLEAFPDISVFEVKAILKAFSKTVDLESDKSGNGTSTKGGNAHG